MALEMQATDTTQSAKTQVLHAIDLYRFYHSGDEETLALRGVSLDVAEGELVAVMGPSGSGKSTLLACIAGLDEPDGGSVDVLGQRLTRRPEPRRAALRAAYIGILLQSNNLFDHLSVQENILLQMHLALKVDRGRIKELAELVGLQGRLHSLPSQLSGGEAARAGLAVALAASPTLLLADEPTGEVDARTEAHILSIFEARRQMGAATLVATHSHALAARADRVIHLLDGRIVDEG